MSLALDNPAIGLERGEDGHAIGRDPRTMTTAELESLGHERMSPLEAIRARCVDCCAGSVSEVRKCTAVKCPSWPFRMGSSPWRAPASEAQMAARREAGKRLAAGRLKFSSNPISGIGKNSEGALAGI